MSGEEKSERDRLNARRGRFGERRPGAALARRDPARHESLSEYHSDLPDRAPGRRKQNTEKVSSLL